MKGFLGALALFVLGLTLGFGARDLAVGHAPNFTALKEALGQKGRESPDRPTAVFNDALATVREAYYGDPKTEDLTYAAIQGMLDSLGDPHTAFLPPEFASRFDERTQGRFLGTGGIGAELGVHELGALVGRVFRGGPAERAGIKPGDIITKVNGESIVDVEAAVGKIRGEEGTQVTLEVLRPSTGQTKTYRLTREKVVIQDVYGEMLEDHIGYLLIRSFSDTIVSQFDRELADLERKGLKGLIIDVRDNPGGLLERAGEMLARFLDGKLIVTLEERGGSRLPYFGPRGYADSRNYPIVVLINGNSASAAEIFAGVLRDYQRATLVGEPTYGKGSVQSIYDLPDGAQLKVTIGRYYLPGGDSVQRIENEWGEVIGGQLKPEIEIKNPPGVEQGKLDSDVQLQKALEVLKRKLDGASVAQAQS